MKQSLADSLVQTAMPDTLAQSVVGDATLPMQAEGVLMREVSIAEMLGSQSVNTIPAVLVEEGGTLIDDWFFQLLALLLLTIFIFFIARHKHQIFTMLGRMLRGRLPEDYSVGRRDEVLTRSFLHSSSAIGVLLVTLLLTKYAPLWLPESFDISAGWQSTVAAALSLAAIFAIGVFEQGVLRIIGIVTHNGDVVGTMLYIKRAYFALAAIAMAPIFLLGILSAEKVTAGWNILLAAECAVLTLLFIKETLTFFIDKKIPILHWILYLCTVEVFPLSLIWALTTRS